MARAARLSIHHRSSRGEGSLTETAEEQQPAAGTEADETRQRGKTVHGEPANAGHRVLAPDDAEVEAYLEVALDAPAPERTPQDRPPAATSAAPGHRRRPRLRQPVRPADRAPRPRAQRLLGAPAPRHADGRARAARGPGDHPLRRPDVGVRRRRPQAGRLDLERPAARARHLLRRPADGPRARRRRHPGHPPRVRAGDGPDHPRRRAVRGHRPRAAGLDEPRRLDHAAARGLPRDGADRLDALRGPRRARRGTCTASSSTPRSSTRPRGRDVLRNFVTGIARDRAQLDAGELHRVDRQRDPRARRRARARRPAPTARSSARCRAASTPRSRRRSSTGRWATG